MTSAASLFSYSFTGAIARSNFAVKWCEDGKIAVIAVKGIYILEILPDCTVAAVNNFNVFTHFIQDPCQASISTPKPVNPFLKGGIDNMAMYHSAAEKIDVFDLMLDRSVAPRRSCDDPLNCSSSFWNVDWSPAFFGPRNERHALATLSVAYHARIYTLRSCKQWVVCSDLSQLLFDQYSASGWNIENNSGSDNPDSLREVKVRSHRQSIIGLKWLRNVFEDNGRSYCLLLTLQKDGFLILWKVFQTSADAPETEILSLFDSSVENPISIEISDVEGYSVSLAVASYSGTINLFKLHFSPDLSVVCESLGSLWEEEDEIPAHHMILRTTDKGRSEMVLYAAKSSFIVGISFILTVNGIENVHTGHTAEPVIISGMTPHGEDSVLYTSEIFGTKVATMSKAGLKIKSFALSADSSTYACRGIAKSPYVDSMICTVENVRLPYDHLILRDPCKACFYITKNSPYDVFNELCEGELPLCYKGALLETLRCLARQNGLTSMTFFSEDDTSPNLNHFRVVRWLAAADVAHEKKLKAKDEEKIAAYESVKLKCELKILQKHCISTLVSLKETIPLREEALSALLMCDFMTTMSSCSPGYETLIKSLYHKLGESEENVTPREKCRFDQESIGFTASTHDGCPEGHNFQRCAQSFRLCDERPVRLCPWCKATYHKDSLFDLPSVCTYCLVPLRFSNE